ncbi:MAG: IclR family transcriptional regulator [Kiritimatiellia bacterium]|jgi:DNA-binding IclR family transcriptional regulator
MNSTIRKTKSPAVPVKSLKKALDILSMLAFDDLAREGIALTEVARRMAMPVNTVHNLLKTMAVCGYVSQTEIGTYRAGPRMTEMGRLNRLLASAAAPEMQRHLAQLSDTLDEALVLAALVDGQRVTLCEATPNQAVGVNAAVLESRSLYAVPTGRVLAAYAEPEALERLIERNGLPGADWNDIHHRQALNHARAELRARGHEQIAPDGPDLVSFAVPVLGEGGRLLATLGCHAPLFRCDTQRQTAILARLKRASNDFSTLL